MYYRIPVLFRHGFSIQEETIIRHSFSGHADRVLDKPHNVVNVSVEVSSGNKTLRSLFSRRHVGMTRETSYLNSCVTDSAPATECIMNTLDFFLQ